MTTAHRPTWTAAREHGNEFGGYSSGGVRSAMAHARDVPNQLKMKYRTGHQLEGIADATPEDYAARLDAAERSSGAPQGQLLLAADARVGAEAAEQAGGSAAARSLSARSPRSCAITASRPSRASMTHKQWRSGLEPP